jgi:hypothetical protein
VWLASAPTLVPDATLAAGEVVEVPDPEATEPEPSANDGPSPSSISDVRPQAEQKSTPNRQAELNKRTVASRASRQARRRAEIIENACG